MSGHTHAHTHDNYYNPRCAHAHRGLIIVVTVVVPSVCVPVRSFYRHVHLDPEI